MRIVTWNLNNRANNQDSWDALFALEPDIALLSEVNYVPDDLNGYTCDFETATSKTRHPQRFKTGMIVRGEINAEFELTATQPWVNDALRTFTGNFVCRKIRLRDETLLNVVSVHMPSWQFPHREFTDGDVSDVMLPNYSKMFMSELLWAALKETVPKLGGDFVVGGDFNTSEFLGSTKRQHQANHAAIKRMCDLGFVETVRHINGSLVPTWQDPRKYLPMKHQLDHLYVSGNLQGALEHSFVGGVDTYLSTKLSDHLPLIADFSFDMKTIDDFKNLIRSTSMTRIYKQVMLQAVLKRGGSATRDEIAGDILASDVFQREHYRRNVVDKMPGDRLVRDGALVKDGDTYRLAPPFGDLEHFPIWVNLRGFPTGFRI